MKKLYRVVYGAGRTIIGTIGAGVFAGYIVVLHYLAGIPGSVTRWQEQRRRVTEYEVEAEKIQQQRAEAEQIRAETRAAHPPRVDAPSDNMRVCLLQYPMTFLTEAHVRDNIGKFMASVGVTPISRFTRENERDLAAALAQVGGEFVTTTDSAGFDTGVEIWFVDQTAADRFKRAWL